MPDAQPDPTLHLPSLVIKNFRGIDELTIPRLGRVTLLAGKNGVGKTTVLDAVQIYASRGNDSVIRQVLQKRGDSFDVMANGKNQIKVDLPAVFTNRQIWPLVTISMGTVDGNVKLTIRQSVENEYPDQPTSVPVEALERFSLNPQFEDRSCPPNMTPAICYVMGPDRPVDRTIEQYWSEVALTSHEDRALDALNLMTDAEVERVAALGPPISSRIIQPRRMMAKVKGIDYQVPLRTLGDGAMRTYAIALALAKSSGGFLLIDEVENGIHHSVQPKFWEMVLKTAQRNNVQVLATTHSSDCAYRFGQVASQLPDIEGILYRIQRNVDRLRAVPYPEDQLVIAAEHRIEVR